MRREEEGGRAPQIALPLGLESSRAPVAGDTSRGHIPGTRWGPWGRVPAPWSDVWGRGREVPVGGSGCLRLPLATALCGAVVPPPSRPPGVPLLCTPAPKCPRGWRTACVGFSKRSCSSGRRRAPLPSCSVAPRHLGLARGGLGVDLGACRGAGERFGVSTSGGSGQGAAASPRCRGWGRLKSEGRWGRGDHG